MTLSIGPVTDYLVTKAEAAVAGLTVPDQDGKWQVADGHAREVTNFMFVIGANDPPPDGGAETTEQREWAGLGAKHLTEQFTVPCYIDARLGGDDQKAARDYAEAAFNAFWPLLAADLTFGGLLSFDAAIPDVTSSPGLLGTVAEPARRQLVKFGVYCRNRTS